MCLRCSVKWRCSLHHVPVDKYSYIAYFTVTVIAMGVEIRCSIYLSLYLI